jgi:WD40 repeat protein
MQLRATVWSLVEQREVANIRSPKLLPPKGISFTKNKKFMALAERRELKDWVSIYYTGGDWKLVNTFEVDTFDLNDLTWTKADSAILVWDTPLESKGLGVKSVSISPNQNFMVASLFDTKIRLYNNIS